MNNKLVNVAFMALVRRLGDDVRISMQEMENIDQHVLVLTEEKSEDEPFEVGMRVRVLTAKEAHKMFDGDKPIEMF